MMLSLGLLTAGPAWAADPPAIAATLELDTRVLDPEVGARVESQLAEKLEPLLVDAGYAVVEGSTTSTATIRVRVVAFDAETLDYEVEIQVLRSGAEPVGGTVVCNACSESRLVSRIVEEAPGLVEVKVEAPVMPVDEPEPAAEPKTTPRRVWPIGAMGITGAGLGVAGLVAMSLGVREFEQPADIGESRLGTTVTSSSFTTLGAVTAALGVAALVTGVVLVSTDVTRRSLKKTHHAVHVSPTYVGFQIEHRF